MSIPLCFPMPVTVAAESRIELFPQGEYSAYANVEYRIGTPAVRFVVKRNVIEAQPDSFFAKQLEHQAVMGGGAVHVENTTTVVTLDDPTYCPRLFPIVFNYLNQTFVNPTTAKIATDGLSKEDIEAVRELAKGFLCIKDRTSFLFIVQSPLFHAGIIDFTVNSRLSDDDDTRRNKRAKTSPPTSFITDDRVMHCSIHGVVVTIYLRDIPTSAPWAKSLIGDQVLAMLKKGRANARARGPLPSFAFGDEMPPVPATDDDLMPYPYPIDNETLFFIPATAIVCELEDGTNVVCEGVYDCKCEHIRINAVDHDDYGWLYLNIYVSVSD